LHKKDKRFEDFNDVRAEIEFETTRIAGSTKNVTDRPISLTIYSKNVVELTLVDLPGITKIPVKG
jgi:dynamin 1-like protein